MTEKSNRTTLQIDKDIETNRGEKNPIIQIKERTFFQIMKNEKHVFKNLIIMIICWTVCSFNFFLITFYLKYIPGNVSSWRWASTISSLAECCAYLMGGILYNYIGPKKSLLISFMISGLSMFGLLIIELSKV